MSINCILPLITKGYGLEEEDLNEVLSRERLKDISSKFSTEIKATLSRFSSNDKIRIIQFDELSGSTRADNEQLNEMIAADYHVFYAHSYSNRDCCVIFLYSGCKQFSKELFSHRIIPHEYAHHFQLTKADFPCVLPKELPLERFPEFSKNYGVGPVEGCIFVDEFQSDLKPIELFKDFTERIADFICEEILIEVGFTEMILDQYRQDRRIDPMTRYRQNSRADQKYIKRLTLYDQLSWSVYLNELFANDLALKEEIEGDNSWTIELNRDFNNGKRVFKEMYEILSNLDYTDFRKFEHFNDYIKGTLDFLNIRIETNEKW